MKFEIHLKSMAPLTGLTDKIEVLKEFGDAIGYCSRGSDNSIALKLLGLFLNDMEKHWGVEELINILETTRPTLYRHLNKLKSLGVLEDDRVDITISKTDYSEEDTTTTHKNYRIKYANISEAWDIVERNVENTMEKYRLTIDHIQRLYKFE